MRLLTSYVVMACSSSGAGLPSRLLYPGIVSQQINRQLCKIKSIKLGATCILPMVQHRRTAAG